MKKTLIILLALTTSLLACGNCGCSAKKGCDTQQQGCKSKKGHHKSKSLRPLFYALNIMELRDHADISLAIQSYKMTVRSLDRSLNTDAFKDGKFDRERFINEHALNKKMVAQAELFETIYTILDDKQKVRLHQLMAADVYYKGQRQGACSTKRACDGTGPNPDCLKKQCDGTGPNPDCPQKKCDGTGPNPNCPKKQ